MIGVVGCGFLGSLFTEELLKRFFAFKHEEKLLFIDSDRIEERNAANQLWSPSDRDLSKAAALHAQSILYSIPSECMEVRLTQENVSKLLSECRLIIDAVDNLETRTILWKYGVSHKIPILHLGISMFGSGCVDWSAWDEFGAVFDTWGLSPLALAGKKAPKIELPELPPCELVSFRGLGLNTSLAAAKAVGIWLGHDPEKHMGKICPVGIMTTWSSTTLGHSLEQVFGDVEGYDYEEVTK